MSALTSTPEDRERFEQTAGLEEIAAELADAKLIQAAADAQVTWLQILLDRRTRQIHRGQWSA